MHLNERLRRFAHKSREEKLQSLRFRFKGVWSRLLPGVPLLCRLDCGAWWLAWNDDMGDGAFCRTYEPAEVRFVERFLAPGMTFIDAGAHHGFYTLVASKKVLSQGRVIAFEPSPRELARLRLHLRLNRCENVWVEEAALGAREGEGRLYIVDGRRTGFNSLRPPEIPAQVVPISVLITTLDGFLARQRISAVDFLKLDLEGGELDVLSGAKQLLDRPPRPVILSEVQEARTAPWGYRAREVPAFLRERSYRWFRPRSDGALETMDDEAGWGAAYNFVAVPEERLSALASLID